MVVETATEAVTNLSFLQQVCATLIGVVAGFLFSFILFYIKELVSSQKKKKNLLECLKYEFEYNLNLFKKYLGKIEECIVSVNGDRKDTYLNRLDYSLIAAHFSRSFYSEGLIIKYLHVENMKRWNDFLSSHSDGSEEYLLEQLEKWRKSEIAKKEIITSLQLEEKLLKHSIEMIVYLKEQIFGQDKKSIK